MLGVEADDVGRVEAVGGPLLERVVLPVRDPVVGDRPDRDSGALESRHDPASSFTLAELGLEEADDVDAFSRHGSLVLHGGKRTAAQCPGFVSSTSEDAFSTLLVASRIAWAIARASRWAVSSTSASARTTASSNSRCRAMYGRNSR